MKVYLLIWLASLLFCVSTLSVRCDSSQHTTQSPLVIAGVVEEIGKHPGATSGYYKIYQLAKYRVVVVCAGAYQQKEIIVDHLLVSGDELTSLRIGDRVYLTLSASKTISIRSNQEGIRSPSETVETFYIGDKPDITPPPQCKD